MKVYEDMKGSYIRINKPNWEAGTEFIVWEHDNSIELIKFKDDDEEVIGGSEDGT